MTEFASRWPDVKAWAVGRLNATLGPDVKVSAERHEELPIQIVVSVVPQQMETTISRFFIINVEAWHASGKESALELANEAAFQIESAPRNSNPVVKAALNAGPNENRDGDDGEYSYSSAVLVTIHRLRS